MADTKPTEAKTTDAKTPDASQIVDVTPPADLSTEYHYTVQPGEFLDRDGKRYGAGEQVVFSAEDVEALTVNDLLSRGIIR